MRVKRIFLDRSSYAQTRAQEAPLYHHRNVVAYPQNPDAALRTRDMSAASLASVLQVQFVGEDRARLRWDPDLQVSVEKLRSAFLWLSLNTWPFMEATKTHELWEANTLDKSFAELLDQSARSIGSTHGGVPSEIIQGAPRICAEHSQVSALGPADCVATDASKTDESQDNDTHAASGNQCAGVLDGGIDEISPLLIWDTCMKKHKVAQLCAEELQRLKNSDEYSTYRPWISLSMCRRLIALAHCRPLACLCRRWLQLTLRAPQLPPPHPSHPPWIRRR